MAQNVVDFSGNPTGAGLMDDYLDKDQQNVLTSNSGIQRPSYAVAGTKWLDTSANPWVWKMYDGTNDVSLGTVNPSTHLFTPAGVLPSQENQSGKFLQTNGTNTVWANAVDYTNITNCITKIPQDIKLELNNGVLTLKAGSKGYMGDGTVRTTTGTLTVKNTGDAQMFLHIAFGGRDLYAGYMTGGTVSERPSSPIRYASYYNTSTQKCEFYNGSSWIEASLPIAIVTRGADGFTSIDQVFNGFGYIGGTVFALPGVEGLIPNGRNTDGSLNNTKLITTSVFTYTPTTGTYNVLLSLLSNRFAWNDSARYDAENNYNINDVGIIPQLILGYANVVSGKITSFNPKLPIKIIDDQEVVHKTGNENIYDRKNFIGSGIGIVKSGSAIDIQNNAVDLSVTDGSVYGTSEIHFIDKNGKVQGIFEHQNRTNGDSVIIMAARNHANTKWVTLEAGFNKNDTAFTNAPNPLSDSNNNDIATTAWVRQYGAQLNYSAAITISGTGEKTASVNGVLIGTPIHNNRSEQLIIIIDGKTFFFTPGNSGEDNNHMSQCYLPVAKGQSYNVVEINNNVQLLLVPYV